MFASQGRELQRGQVARHERDDRAGEFRPQSPAVSRDRRARADPHEPSRAHSRPAAHPLFVGQAGAVRGLAVRSGNGREMLLLFNTSTEPLRPERPGRDTLHGIRRAGGRLPADRAGARQRPCRASARSAMRCAMLAEEASAEAPSQRPLSRGGAARRSTRSIRAALPTANGDGIGDLPGITARLDYVASLGVDAIWLSPFFTSPMRDFGYDVADYCDVDPVFGTLADFDALVERAHALGAQGHHRPGLFAQLRPARLVPGKPLEPRQSQGRLVRLGGCQAGRLAAEQLAVGVRRPGVDVGCAARPILSAQLSDRAAGPQPAQSARSRMRCSTSRASGSIAESTASASMRSTSRCTTPSCATIRRRPVAGKRTRLVRFPAAPLQPVASRHREIPRAAAAGDRQLRRSLHAGRGRRRALALAKCARSRRAIAGSTAPTASTSSMRRR